MFRLSRRRQPLPRQVRCRPRRHTTDQRPGDEGAGGGHQRAGRTADLYLVGLHLPGQAGRGAVHGRLAAGAAQLLRPDEARRRTSGAGGDGHQRTGRVPARAGALRRRLGAPREFDQRAHGRCLDGGDDDDLCGLRVDGQEDRHGRLGHPLSDQHRGRR